VHDEQTPTTNETPTPTPDSPAQPEPGSSTSTTEATPTPAADDETINLGAQPDADKAAEDEGDADKEQAAANEYLGAPAEGETYELEGLPEGTVVDKDALAAIEPHAREIGLSSKGLSKLAGVYAETILPNVAKQVQAQIIDGLNQDAIAQRREWEGQVRELVAGKGEPLVNAAGEPIGFDGKSMQAVTADAAKVLDRLAPQGFREWLDETGLGTNPQMIGFVYNMSKLIVEDRELEATETGGQRSGTKGRPMSDPGKFYNRE
jgi:hypothetical protein